MRVLIFTVVFVSFLFGVRAEGVSDLEIDNEFSVTSEGLVFFKVDKSVNYYDLKKSLKKSGKLFIYNDIESFELKLKSHYYAGYEFDRVAFSVQGQLREGSVYKVHFVRNKKVKKKSILVPFLKSWLKDNPGELGSVIVAEKKGGDLEFASVPVVSDDFGITLDVKGGKQPYALSVVVSKYLNSDSKPLNIIILNNGKNGFNIPSFETNVGDKLELKLQLLNNAFEGSESTYTIQKKVY